ncbi:MAG: hypothetical protein N4A35_02820 [Flavobacteriales bacterium]|jgi:hypothetical protein|nr:hypothetical protein [Flavobacteriales bacterium]
MTTYYLGMAKSSLNLKGAKSQKLELDLLRLIYLIKTKEKERIVGFLMVYDEAIKARCLLWIKKYEALDLIDNNLLFIDTFYKSDEKSATIEFVKILEEEKANNKKAITGNNPEAAMANKGRKIIEKALHQFMAKIIGIPQKVNAIDEDQIEFDISWDGYYTHPNPPETH